MSLPVKLTGTFLLIALAGCANAPQARLNAGNRPPDIDLTQPAVAAAKPAKRASKPSPPKPNFLSLPEATWISLGRWARANHLGTITNLHASTVPTFALNTPAGEFLVRTGSVLAEWCGLEIRLGFAPKLIDDQPFIHKLDLQKNLIPLLTATPPPSPGARVIVLDPGHGGHDSGTCSATGKLEKDYTLDWAARLQTQLEAEGWHVFLTRTNDVDVTLADRVNFAIAHQADLFVSLHFNAATSPVHAGIETYCVTPTGMPSAVTRGYEDNEALTFLNNQFDAQNLSLAFRLHRAVLSASGCTDRGVRRARFLTVLRGQNCPAVLLEGGYLSNPDEAAQIETAKFREKLAKAVAKALQ